MMKNRSLILLLSFLVTHSVVVSRPVSGVGRDSSVSVQGRRARRGTSQASQASKDIDALAASLRTAGVKVGKRGRVSQPFFSVGGQILAVIGEDVQVFRYATARAAEREAGRVSPDGSGVGTSMVSWISTPHFFRKDNLIVLYVGDDAGVLRALGAVLGNQFAGGGGGE
jgi:hypothetical protein